MFESKKFQGNDRHNNGVSYNAYIYRYDLILADEDVEFWTRACKTSIITT